MFIGTIDDLKFNDRKRKQSTFYFYLKPGQGFLNTVERIRSPAMRLMKLTFPYLEDDAKKLAILQSHQPNIHLKSKEQLCSYKNFSKSENGNTGFYVLIKGFYKQ